MLPFTINPSAIPTVRTRKALLIMDLQNDFVSPDGALHADEPDGYVDRILDLAKTFRDSGAGDVIWVRSEFDRHCSLLEDGDQIITADALMRPKKGPPPSRGRHQTSPTHDGAAMENDEEAFLSIGVRNDKEPCVRKGTKGAEFAPDVKAAIAAGRDIVLTKTHYSAFASGQTQLVQLLRGRFVTQMYVCGALTNISIYATALGAGQHGYDVTLVEDCCGFRSTMRHLNAVRQLVHLTGCEVVSFEGLTEELEPPAPAPQARSTGLSPSISKISLARGGGSPDTSPAAAPLAPRPTPPPKAASPQPDRDEGAKPRLRTPPRRRVSNQSSRSVNTTRPSDTGPLEADSDPSPSECESTHSPERKPGEPQRNSHPATGKRSELESSKGPTLLPGPRDAKAERPRVINRVKQRLQRPNLDKKPSPPASSESIAIRLSLSRNTAKPETKAAAKDIAETEPKSPRNMADPQPASAGPASGEPLCEGDTNVITNVLPPALAADAFERLLEEVSWASMSHMGGEVPRRIAVQGAVAEDGSMPVYRHPADESPPLLPFSPTVLQIKDEVEKHLGHPLNHVLIQHYRTGNDYISEHSDKTLDIAQGSFIANVSLGAERTMVFRTKRPPKEHQTAKPSDSSPNPDEPTTTTTTPEPKRQTHRAPLPHNSLLRMGLATNARWLHSIRQDKRLDRDKAPAELAFAGARISLTFRHIATFLDAAQARIWGQGATRKTREAGAAEVVNGQTEEAVRLLRAFGAENNRGDVFGEVGWAEWYGAGFDVLHMGTPKRVFFASAGAGAASASGVGGLGEAAAAVVVNMRVALALAELGVGCAKGSVEGGEVKLEDNDPGRAVVEGHASVLRYLDAVYGAGRRYDQMGAGEVARRFTRLQRGLDLWGKWRAAVGEVGLQEGEGVEVGEELRQKVKKVLGKELADWEAWAEEGAAAGAAGDKTTPGETEQAGSGCFYIAGGNQPSPADFAVWPVLHNMVRVCGEELLGEHLRRYYAAFKERSSVAKALGQFMAE